MPPRLWILIQAFAHLLPPGDVIDAGANDGADSSRFARLFDQRTVLAIEPTVASTRHIMKTYVERQGQHNIEVLRAGLGEAEGSANYSALLDHRVGAQVGDYEPGSRSRKHGHVSFPVFTVDRLFANRKLAFAHWDVEGWEDKVLAGAKRTLRRDRPPFVIETHSQVNQRPHDATVAFAAQLNYSMYTIQEKCGHFCCRNHICIPNERVRDFLPVLAGGNRHCYFAKPTPHDGCEPRPTWAQSELNQMKWDHLTELTPWTGPPPLTAASAAAAAAGTGDIAQLRSEVAALRRDDANVKAQLGAIQAGLAALQEQFRPLLQSKGARLRRLARV